MSDQYRGTSNSNGSGSGRQWNQGGRQQSQERGNSYQNNDSSQGNSHHHEQQQQQQTPNGRKDSWPRQQQLPQGSRADDPQRRQRPQQSAKQLQTTQPQSQSQPQKQQHPPPFKPPLPRPSAWGQTPAPKEPAQQHSLQQQQQQQPTSLSLQTQIKPQNPTASRQPQPTAAAATPVNGWQNPTKTTGAWGAQRLPQSNKQIIATSVTSAATMTAPTLLKKENGGPPLKKNKNNKHANNKKDTTAKNNNNNNNKNLKIHGKKPKLASISMGDLVPGIKQILPKDKNKKMGHPSTAATTAIGKQQQSARNQSRPVDAASDFPALPSTSNWPSLATTQSASTLSAKAPAVVPQASVAGPSTSTAKKAPTRKQTKGNNNSNNNNNSASKKRKSQSQQKDPKNGKGKNNNNNNNSNNNSIIGERTMKVDDAHRSAQFFLPPGKSLDRNHMQGQLSMGNAMGGQHDLMRMMQGGQVVKGRQRIKPQKKRFTALKRKILLERLRVWKEMHPVETDDKDGAGSGGQSSCTICVYGFASLDELEDADEYEELLANLKDMAEKVGTTTHVFIPRVPLEPLESESPSSKVHHPAFVEFSAPAEAMAARGCWEGLAIGGQALSCIPLNVDTTTSTDGGSIPSEEDWQALCIDAERVANSSDATSGVINSDGAKVTLKDVLTEDDLGDDDCFSESIQDIQKLVEQFGNVQDIIARKQEGNLDVTVVYNGGPDVGYHAAEGLSTLTLGGTQISAEYVPTMQATTPSIPTRLLLENVLTEDDLDDEDCLEESLQDVRSLLEKHGTVSSLDVTNGTIVISFDGVTPEELDEIAIKLNGVCLGGQTIKASCFADSSTAGNLPCVFLRNLLTQDDVDDDDCLEESLEDVRELARQHGEIVSIEVDRSEEIANCTVKITYITSNEAEAAAKEFEGLIVGGEAVAASTNLKSFDQSSLPEASATGSTPDPSGASKKFLAGKSDEPKPMFSGDKRIPERFAECKRVPKVPNKGTPRNYAIMTNDDTVKPLLVEMLNELTRLQLRALHDPNAKNAKARRRIVAGLREVARGIRSNKVKMVVMAHNLDDFGAIDEKLQEILDLAAEKEVPVLFELSKRVLGKAVSKKIKVSVVGIQSTDGAHRQYVELSKLAPHLEKTSSIMEEST